MKTFAFIAAIVTIFVAIAEIQAICPPDPVIDLCPCAVWDDTVNRATYCCVTHGGKICENRLMSVPEQYQTVRFAC